MPRLLYFAHYIKQVRSTLYQAFIFQSYVHTFKFAAVAMMLIETYASHLSVPVSIPHGISIISAHE